MKTKTIAVVLFLLTTALAVDAQEHSTDLSDAGWTRFTSAAGRFSVLLPGEPTENVESKDSPHGPYTTHSFVLKAEERIYLVAWVDYDPSFNFDVKAELNANRDNFVKGFEARLTGTTRQITIDGNPGIEFTAARADAVVKSRVYVVGRRPLMLIAISRDTNDNSPDIERFLNSLTVNRR